MSQEDYGFKKSGLTGEGSYQQCLIFSWEFHGKIYNFLEQLKILECYFTSSFELEVHIS